MGFIDVLSAIGSIVLIALVLVLTYVASRWYARRMSGSAMGKYVKVVDRMALGQGVSLVISQVGERFYLLGVSDKNVQLITELVDFDLGTSPETMGLSAPFGDTLRQWMDKVKKTQQKKDDGGQ